MRYGFETLHVDCPNYILCIQIDISQIAQIFYDVSIFFAVLKMMTSTN